MGDSGLLWVGTIVCGILSGVVVVIVAMVAVLVTWSDKRRSRRRP